MNLLSSLQFTLNRIFDLYRNEGKQYYNFSMLFTIFSLLFCTLFVGIVLLIRYFAIAVLDGHSFQIERLFSHTNFLVDLTIYTQFMVTLTIALFGIFLYARREKQGSKVQFSDFFTSIPAETWGLYFLFTAGGILFSTYANALMAPETFRGDSLSYMLEAYGPGGSPFENWLISLGQLVLAFLPVGLAYVLVRRYLVKQGVVLQKPNGRTAFFSLLILGFSINVLSGQVVSFVGNYLLKLVMIPFQEPLIPSILSIVVYVFLIAVFYPALAGASIFPFLHHNNQQEPVNETLLDEL